MLHTIECPPSASPTSAAASSASAAPAATAPGVDAARVTAQLRYQIGKLPFFSVFDDISATFQDGVATLRGAVRRPSLRPAAEHAALAVEGVERVDNQVELLPKSRFDDQIRQQAAHQIYNHGKLARCGVQSMPPVRILVRHGDVTLVGCVTSAREREAAGLLASQVPGVFSVTNELRVESPRTV